MIVIVTQSSHDGRISQARSYWQFVLQYIRPLLFKNPGTAINMLLCTNCTKLSSAVEVNEREKGGFTDGAGEGQVTKVLLLLEDPLITVVFEISPLLARSLYRNRLFNSQSFVIDFLPYVSDFPRSLKHRAKVDKIAVSKNLSSCWIYDNYSITLNAKPFCNDSISGEEFHSRWCSSIPYYIIHTRPSTSVEAKSLSIYTLQYV